jgi:tetratricopeptide (TPR) repeat protein
MPEGRLNRLFFTIRERRSPRILAGTAFLTCVLAVPGAHADRQSPAPPQPSQPSAAPSPASTAPAEAPPYNPLPAEKDVEVATYYMKKGDPDASIPRLEEAIQLKPDYAKPRLMLAEIYEKKGDKENALKYYREYLQVFPHAPDAKKVQEKIAKLAKS